MFEAELHKYTILFVLFHMYCILFFAEIGHVCFVTRNKLAPCLSTAALSDLHKRFHMMQK